MGKASQYQSELTCADHRLPKSRTWQIFWVRINLPVPTVNTIILFPVWFRECNCHAHDLFENILPVYVNEWGSQRASRQEVRALTEELGLLSQTALVSSRLPPSTSAQFGRLWLLDIIILYLLSLSSQAYLCSLWVFLEMPGP